jgi:O-antigen/teichoic acid export membrane protein
MFSPIGGVITAVGHPEVSLMLNVVAMIVGLGLNILLLPKWGIVGAAAANAISTLLWTVIFFVMLVKIVHIKIDFRWFSIAIGCGGVMVAIYLIGREYINPYVVGAILLCAYAVLVYQYLLTREDKSVIRSLAISFLSRT